jgi:hypothetical protein
MELPSVKVIEQDYSHYYPPYTSEVACFVGFFEKGPINQPQFIYDINQFKEIFGRGIELYQNSWYQIYNYLAYAAGVWVCRTAGLHKYNSNNSGSTYYINSKEEFEEMYDILPENLIISQTAGENGNLMSVAVFLKDAWTDNEIIGYDYRATDIFDFFQDNRVGICVFRKEKLIKSYYFDTRNDVEDINTELNNQDSELYFKFETFSNNFGDNIIKLENGHVDFPSDIDLEESHEIFKSKEDYNIDIVIGNEFHNQGAIDIANSRKDCIAFIGIPVHYFKFLKLVEGHVLHNHEGKPIATHYKRTRNKLKFIKDDLLEYIDSLEESMFVHLTANVKQQYDGFTDKNILINLAGDAAGLKSQASLSTPWTPGAGLERGQILNGESLQLNLNKEEKGTLHALGCNIVENSIILTQRTFITKATSFDRINVRSLFNHIEKEVVKYLREYIFEENSLYIRRQITYEVKRILEDARAARGIQAGFIEVHPSESNPNEITVDVYIKPTYMVEYIHLRMNNVGTNTISEIVSSTKG